MVNTASRSAVGRHRAAEHDRRQRGPSYLAGTATTPAVPTEAAVHGYTVAFWWSAGIFPLGAIVSGTLLRPGAAVALAEAQPAVAV